MTARKFICYDCQHNWEVPYGTSKPQECPSCKGTNVLRAPEDRGPGRKSRRGQRGQRARGRGMNKRDINA